MIRYPQITGSDAQKIEQIKRYLITLADELNYEYDKTVSKEVSSVSPSGSPQSATETPIEKFNDIKGLIIKSADIVNAYYETISRKLEGVYVAESDFGTFAQQTSHDIEENSTYIQNLFTNLQTIISDVEGIGNKLVDVSAHIKSGYLYDAADGTPVYGIEVGQRTEVDGAEVFNKYARFTADGIEFYGRNGSNKPVAYIRNSRLYITAVEIVSSLTMGGFIDEVQTTDKSIVTKWIGG